MSNFIKDFLDKIKPTYDDTAVDRVHYVYTCSITTLFALTIGLYQFGGNPIKCWVPKEYTGAWTQYVHDYCFVENTYFLTWHENIPQDVQTRDDREIIYYQWVPFVLALQAVMFFVPHVIWNVLSKQTGINVEKIVNMARETKTIDFGNRAKNEQLIAAHIDKTFHLQSTKAGDRHWSAVTRAMFSSGNTVVVLYLFIKVLYLVNVLAQFAILNAFLSPGYSLWGFGILSDIVHGRDWQVSGHFPRTTMCDFEVKTLGNVNRRSVQCVLWINMLNEKIFLFLWFWFFLLSILTIFDFFYLVVVSLSPELNRTFVTKFLRVKKLVKLPRDNLKVRQFLQMIKPDGVFVLRLLAQNAGELISSDIIRTMWKRKIPEDPEPVVPSRRAPQPPSRDVRDDTLPMPMGTPERPPPYNGNTDRAAIADIYPAMEQKKMD